MRYQVESPSTVKVLLVKKSANIEKSYLLYRNVRLNSAVAYICRYVKSQLIMFHNEAIVVFRYWR